MSKKLRWPNYETMDESIAKAKARVENFCRNNLESVDMTWIKIVDLPSLEMWVLDINPVLGYFTVHYASKTIRVFNCYNQSLGIFRWLQ